MNQKQVTVRVVRDDGKEMSFGTGTDWNIPNDGLENWANLPHTVNIEPNVTYDGGTVTGKRIESVDRSIKAELAVPDRAEHFRELLVRFFNPKHTFEAHLTYQGRTLWCVGEQLGFKCETGNVYKPVTFEWTILCPMPYLLSEDDFGKNIAAVTPKFGFPFTSATDVSGDAAGKVYAGGFVWSAYDFARTVEIDNDGDVETFCKAIITASGDVTNPKLMKGGRFVRVVDKVGEGDAIEIDFIARPPRVTKNGANIIHKTDRLSSFVGMGFNVGLNTIQYDADDGVQYMNAALYYNKRYLGV